MTYLKQYIEPADAWLVTSNTSKVTPFFHMSPGDLAIALGGSAIGAGYGISDLGYRGGEYPPTHSLYWGPTLYDGSPKSQLGYLVNEILPTAIPLDLYAFATANIGSVLAYGFGVVVLSGIGSIDDVQVGSATAAPSLSITTTVTDEPILVLCVDNVAIDGASRTWRQVNGHDPTEIRYTRVNSVVTQPYTVYLGLYENTGAPGAKTVGLSAPAAQNYSMVAISLLPRTLATKTVGFDANLVPAVGMSIVTPAAYGLVNAASFPATWIFNSTQVKYQAKIYSDAAGLVLVYDSGLVSSAVQGATLATGAALTSNKVYYLRVYAENGSTAQGLSDLQPFYFALPTSVNITGLRAVAFPACDPTPQDNPSILLTWTRPDPTETFLAYEVRRRKTGETTYIPIARITSALTNTYTDANIQPGQEYEYVVVFYGDVGSSSTKVSAEQVTPVRATVRFDWNYVHEVASSQTEFFRLESAGGDVAPIMDITAASTWGRTAPTAFVGEQFASAISLPGLDKLRKRPRDWAKFMRMMGRQSTAGTTLCLRMGLDRELYFVSMMSLSKSLAERSWTETAQFQEVAYEESIGYYVHVPGDPA